VLAGLDRGLREIVVREDRLEEASQLGLTSQPLKTFALDYIHI